MIRSLFFGIQEANKLATRPQGVPTQKFTRIGMLGAGMMGAGIAMSTATAGIEVVLLDRTQEDADKGKAYAIKQWTKLCEKGRMKPEEAQALAARIHTTADYAQSQLKRHKTDAVDAELIADFCRTQQPPLWTAPSAAERELRALVRHRDDLKGLRQAEKNRLEAQPPSATVVRHLHALVELLERQIAEAEAQIRNHIDRHPDLKAQHDLLTSIPGIGDQTSFQLLAELGDLRRFTDVRQVVALGARC